MLLSLGSAEKKEHMEKIDKIGSDLSKLLAQQRQGVTQSQPANLERKLDEVSKNSKDIIQYSDAIYQMLSKKSENNFDPQMLLSQIKNILAQQQGCCFKEKMQNDGIPLDFQNYLHEVFNFISQLESNYKDSSPGAYSLAGQKNWRDTLNALKRKLDDLKRNADTIPELQRRENELKSSLVALQQEVAGLKLQAEKKDKELEERKEEIALLQLDAEEKEKKLIDDWQKKLDDREKTNNLTVESIKENFSRFAPGDILSIFNVDLASIDKNGNNKRLMAVYSYLSLLKELRGSVFTKRFAGFDRDLLASFQGDELFQVRKNVEEHLNTQIESEGYKVHWPLPEQRINPELHYDETNAGQIIAKVKSAIIYKTDENGVFKCEVTASVETR